MLRLGLHRSRLPVEEINIWEDPAAAAAVRAITGGDETVPTVVVGAKAMVNPSARQVIAAVRAELPGISPAAGAQPASWLARVRALLTAADPGRSPPLTGAASPGTLTTTGAQGRVAGCRLVHRGRPVGPRPGWRQAQGVRRSKWTGGTAYDEARVA
jgi:mycoredoxin